MTFSLNVHNIKISLKLESPYLSYINEKITKNKNMHSELGLSRYAGASLALELERTMPMNSLLNGYHRFLLSSLKND